MIGWLVRSFVRSFVCRGSKLVGWLEESLFVCLFGVSFGLYGYLAYVPDRPNSA